MILTEIKGGERCRLGSSKRQHLTGGGSYKGEKADFQTFFLVFSTPFQGERVDSCHIRGFHSRIKIVCHCENQNEC